MAGRWMKNFLTKLVNNVVALVGDRPLPRSTRALSAISGGDSQRFDDKSPPHRSMSTNQRRRAKKHSPNKRPVYVYFGKPALDEVIVSVDAALNPDIPKARIAVAIRDSLGTLLEAAAGECKIPSTVLFHELEGVYAGIDLAANFWALNGRRITVITDNERAADLVNGVVVPKPKEGYLMYLVFNITAYIAKLKSEGIEVTVRHDYRQTNQVAHHLVSFDHKYAEGEFHRIKAEEINSDISLRVKIENDRKSVLYCRS